MKERDISRDLIQRALAGPEGPSLDDQAAWAIRNEVNVASDRLQFYRRSLAQRRARGDTGQGAAERLASARERWEQVRAKYGLDEKGKLKE